MNNKKCRECGGDIVLEIDKNRICPECLRLRDFVQDMELGHYKTDMHRIPGGYRRYAPAG